VWGGGGGGGGGGWEEGHSLKSPRIENNTGGTRTKNRTLELKQSWVKWGLTREKDQESSLLGKKRPGLL